MGEYSSMTTKGFEKLIFSFVAIVILAKLMSALLPTLVTSLLGIGNISTIPLLDILFGSSGIMYYVLAVSIMVLLWRKLQF